MENFDKLYIHLFTKGIEHYRDSKTVLKKIEEILKTDEEILFKKLHEAFNQANRVNILKENGVPITADNLGSNINTPLLPESLLERLLSNSIELPTLKNIMRKQINKKR